MLKFIFSLNITKYIKFNDSHFYIEYDERLTLFPVILNYGRGYYKIIISGDDENLLSQHTTCFYTDLTCRKFFNTINFRFLNFSGEKFFSFFLVFPVPTESMITLSKNLNETNGMDYKEKIFFLCPWILSLICFNEISYQRFLIIDKLHEIFSHFHN